MEINKPMTPIQPIGEEQLKEFTEQLRKYKAGKAQTESRILASEQWWKLRNASQEQEHTTIKKDGSFNVSSGWLHNVIVNKHADAVEAYPEPNILPREESDKAEAQMLSSILPCVLEQNDFEQTYSDAMWQKIKTGTGVYKVTWDATKLNGLGDISIERVNLLNIYWQPGIVDIQKSKYIFHTELIDNDVLESAYPQTRDKLKGNTFISTRFLYDDSVSTDGMSTVIDVYYHTLVEGRKVLQYCKYVNDIVLYSTENDPEMSAIGLYAHGLYPYVFDALYPIEGSPCGYGYVDVCKNPQTSIDLINSALIKNAIIGSTPRYFSRGEGNINEEEFLDISNPIVHVGSVDDMSLKPIAHSNLDGVYINVLDRTIQEMRETSGNTETSTGNTSSGVTAASAIAALQEASGKGSRDSTKTSYRAFTEIVNMCIELIRQFYDLPRKFRIVGERGAAQFVTYTNANIKPYPQGEEIRLPIFDIKVSAQKKNVYSKVSQNELAIQLFQLGFFNSQLADQALMCLEIMDFDGKDDIIQMVSKNMTLVQKLQQYMQLSMALAQAAGRNDIAQGIAQELAAQGVMSQMPSAGANISDGANGIVDKARAQSQDAAQPNENSRVI